MSKISRYIFENNDTYTENSEHDWDLLQDALKDTDKIYYWYRRGDYFGNGVILAYRGKKWSLLSFSHCSCYGPDEAIEKLDYCYKRLQDIINKLTPKCLDEAKPLIQMAAAETGDELIW